MRLVFIFQDDNTDVNAVSQKQLQNTTCANIPFKYILNKK